MTKLLRKSRAVVSHSLRQAVGISKPAAPAGRTGHRGVRSKSRARSERTEGDRRSGTDRKWGSSVGACLPPTCWQGDRGRRKGFVLAPVRLALTLARFVRAGG